MAKMEHREHYTLTFIYKYTELHNININTAITLTVYGKLDVNYQSVSDEESAPFSSSFSSGSLIGNRKMAAIPERRPSSVTQVTSAHCDHATMQQ